MSHEIFRQGGPHNIRKVGHDRYAMTVKIPTDAIGMIARECSDAACSPGAFKVKPGTGITDGHEKAFCPYCRRSEDPEDFKTKEQQRYLRDIVKDQASQGVERMMKDALGLDSRGKRKFGGGLISMEMSMKPSHRPPVRRPWEDDLPPDNQSRFCEMICQAWTHSGKVTIWLGSDTRRSRSSANCGRSRCTSVRV